MRNPRVAELAVAVVDDWQGHGVGGRLASALADRARDEGITSFTALVLAENKPILNLLGDLGRLRDIHSEQGTMELTVDLPERGLGHLYRLLRAFARAELTALGYPPRSTPRAVGAPLQGRRSGPVPVGTTTNLSRDDQRASCSRNGTRCSAATLGGDGDVSRRVI